MMKSTFPDHKAGHQSLSPKANHDVLLFERPTSSHTRSKTNVDRVRRQSLLEKRSRSDTVGSTSTSGSSFQSFATSTTSLDPASRRSSVQNDPAAGTAPLFATPERPDVMAKKSLLARSSRILRRHGSKFNISTAFEEEVGAMDNTKIEMPNLLQRRQRKARQSTSQTDMKSLISEPFNFQHLTHTKAGQFQDMENTSRNDLVSEFSAIRASQKPYPDLKGIKAESLHLRGFSEESLQYSRQRSVSAESIPVSPTSPTSPLVSQHERHHSRQQRSIENFSRPIARTPKNSISGLDQRRPTSSGMSDVGIDPSAQTIDAILGDYDGSKPVFSNVDYTKSPSHDGERPAILSMQGLISPAEEAEEFQFGHAITATESLDHCTSLGYASELEDVKEEEETSFLDLSASVKTSRRGSRRPSMRQARSLPKMQLMYDNATQQFRSPSAAGPLSPGMEVLQSPVDATWAEHISSPPTRSTPRRFSMGLRGGFGDSWEDDIDYCYEHAAESNCDFDWNRPSLDAGEDVREQLSNELAGTNGAKALGAAFGDNLQEPELDMSSTQTASTTTMTTPETSTSTSSSKKNSYFSHPPLTIRTSYGDVGSAQEAVYDELLDGADDEHRVHIFGDNGFSPSELRSPRTSSLFSKCNSQESVILSRAASVVRKHRSSVSTSSVPELVHSVCGSNDFSEVEVPLPVDQGSPSMAQSMSPAPLSPVHRRSKSLAREVAHQNLFKKTASNLSLGDDGEMPMPTLGARKNSQTSYSIFPGPASPKRI